MKLDSFSPSSSKCWPDFPQYYLPFPERDISRSHLMGPRYVTLHTINGLLRYILVSPKVAVARARHKSLGGRRRTKTSCWVFLCNYTVGVSVGADLFWICGRSSSRCEFRPPRPCSSWLICVCVCVCVSGGLEGEPRHLHVRAEEPAGVRADDARPRSAHCVRPA